MTTLKCSGIVRERHPGFHWNCLLMYHLADKFKKLTVSLPWVVGASQVDYRRCNLNFVSDESAKGVNWLGV